MAKKVLKKSLATLMAVAISSSFFNSGVSEAQDLLPADNGIFAGHRMPRYRDSESHPLRILAYAVHPVGWLARELIFRPFSAFAASTETTRSVMGYREPNDYRQPLCFSAADDIPDCKTLEPYASIGKKFGDGDASVRQVYFPEVNFDFNKSALNELGKAKVRQISEMLKSVSDVKIAVEGHADFKGTDEYNMKLGKRRSDSVIAELASLGVETANLSPISYGESKPLFTEETDWARAANRRVQFAVGGEGSVSAGNTEEVAADSALPKASLPK